MMKKTLCTLAVVAAGSLSMSAAAGQTVLAYWAQNSNELAGGGFGFAPDAFPQVADDGEQAGVAALTVGGGGLLTLNGDSTAFQWIPSFAGTIDNALKGYESGGSISPQLGTVTEGVPLNAGGWLEFQASMTGYTGLQFSFAARGTSTGFQANQLSWSTNGVDYTNIGDVFNPVNGSNWTVFTYDFGSLVDDASDVHIRITLGITETQGTSSGGNNRYDNIRFDATPIGGTGCAEDLNGDETVDFADLLALLTAWGECPGCPEDFSGDGIVDFTDLLELLSAWGDC